MTNVGWTKSENLKSKLIHIIFIFVSIRVTTIYWKGLFVLK